MALVVKTSTIQGKGTFTTAEIKKDSLITLIYGKQFSEETLDGLISSGEVSIDDDIQINEDQFLVPEGQYNYFNHNCNPNGGVVDSDKLIAIKDILSGEEIVFDYSTVVGKTKNTKTLFNNLNWFMECCCGASNCRGLVGSVFTIPRPILKKYDKLGIIPKFIVGQLNGQLK